LVDVGLGEETDEVLAGVATTVLDDRVEVAIQGTRCLESVLATTLTKGVLSDEAIRHGLEECAVGDVDAEKLGDHHRRQRFRERGDEVRVVAFRERVDELRRDLLDASFESSNRARCERSADQPTESVVTWRVHHDHHGEQCGGRRANGDALR
jgi:hypothetical protein